MSEQRCLWCLEHFAVAFSWSWVVGGGTGKLCNECNSKMEKITSVICKECGRPNIGNVKMTGEAQCSDCMRWSAIPPWSSQPFLHRALYIYNPFIQEFIARYKYRGDVELATLFVDDLVSLAREMGGFDIVTTIPLREKREWERGFNQADVLAGKFRMVEPLLNRVKNSEDKQSKRTREDRLAALSGAFALREDVERSSLVGKRILLVDDIYTTGATLRSAGATLYSMGAKSVAAVSVARSIGASGEK
ncbi:phosphoribosyltransferase family protein [Evansella sp. AB-rgal1]|uniref:ComF family protein n=1 Tax=Evansella sp. AB-rgal1 TaxID=3242696 RepID=UPI00359E2030